MKRLIPIACLLLSFPAYAQLAAEAGISGGLAMPSLRSLGQTTISTQTHPGWTGGFKMNFSYPLGQSFYISAGLRAMHVSFRTDNQEQTLTGIEGRGIQQDLSELAVPLSLEFRKPLSRTVDLRITAGGGCSLYGGNFNDVSGMVEASSGLMLHDNVTIGLSYYQSFGQHNRHEFYQNKYSISSVMVDVKKRLRKPDPMARQRRRSLAPVVELGLSCGVALAHNERMVTGGTQAQNGFAMMYDMDLNFERKHDVHFYLGTRGGILNTTVGVLGFAMGAKWRQQIATGTDIRIGAGVVPMAGFVIDLFNLHAGIAPEASVGFIFNDKLLLGMKYMHPFHDFRTYNTRYDSNGGNNYKIKALMIEAKLRLKRVKASGH